eukprot:CAMPEP_0201584002 /NCGR_PEP_ID=MMETSP0190_2-20130828/105383_1 /ASSEMBLY_ACC=CAM_ASM_000263 /TAXON_ID=37353 /ORGANISM="Rosalina sp." /LENGTH=80 /DNA_ID=CAMNT_0048027095 /DNA_START=6 /DNA_END=244 /DNA_ORIENTATION=+
MAKLQVEGAVDLQIDPDTIRTWMKANHPTLSEEAINKLQQQGFITIEDLGYCSAENMNKDAQHTMDINIADTIEVRAMSP